MSNQTRLRLTRLLECPPGADYDEEIFRYFLAIEQARAARARQPVRLLLASLEPVPGQPAPFPQAGAHRLFDALHLALRDTDVIGWYRQGRVAGVVLTVPAGAPDAAVSAPLERRVVEDLRQRMPAHLARILRVRVVQRGPEQSVRERSTP